MDLINPLSIGYFKSIVIIFISRMIMIFLILRKRNKILIFEIAVLMLIVLQFLN